MRYHHILDPCGGYSAPHLASTTVLAPNCTWANALAITLMVLDPEAGLALVNALADVEDLLVSKDLKEYRSTRFGILEPVFAFKIQGTNIVPCFPFRPGW
jgi:thiamine biosynthesis lipoprotein